MTTEKQSKKWLDVTDSFSEYEKNYKDKYLEIDEVYDNLIEVSLFSSADERDYEIYFSWDIFYGIIKVNKKEAHAIREEIKKELQSAYLRTPNPTDDFINCFVKKYDVQLPSDIFF